MRMELNWVFSQDVISTVELPGESATVLFRQAGCGRDSIVYMMLPNDTTASETTPEIQFRCYRGVINSSVFGICC